MSNTEIPKEDNKPSETDVSSQVQRVAEDLVNKNPGSQGITINFYSTNYTPKSDKPVQTEPSFSELLLKTSRTGSTKSKKQGSLTSESRELRCVEYTTIPKKKPHVPTHENRHKKLMNARKFSDNKATGRTATDLERKKLEAELKATEEIAKIQQTVIEKRLALELASLQDGNDHHHYKNLTSQHSIPHPDLRVIEEVTRKHNLIEHNLTQDVGSPDWNAGQNRPTPPRPPPPTKTSAADGGKFCNIKTDSGFLMQTSSDLNPLRHLIEKKINLERRSSRTSESKNVPSPTNSNSHDRKRPTSPEARFFKSNHKNSAYAASGQPGCSPQAMRQYRTRSLWKSAMTKIKKKLKPGSKPPETWQ